MAIEMVDLAINIRSMAIFHGFLYVCQRGNLAVRSGTPTFGILQKNSHLFQP